MDAKTRAWIDQENARLVQAVRADGWQIQYVGGGACSAPGCDCPPDPGPPFAYTVGLFGLGHAELLVFGLGAPATCATLNEIGRRIQSGGDVVAGWPVEVSGFDRPLIPEVIPNPGEIVFGANAFYERPPEYSVPVLQLAYADDVGRYPWQEGCAVAGLQPRPGTFRA